jgi:flagellin
MSLTVQTNIASLIAQTNLNINSEFMTQTITRLTSGYRINSSADDAAGLVIANQYRSNIAELTQGIRNANDGVSTLQIVDGGLNNISTMLDRMKTLATESSSGTFSGNRATLDQEYQQLVGEITRQASNIGLNSGGSNNSVINVYIGGGSVQANSQIKVDLSGSGNTVDATGLGVNGTTLLAPGSAFGSVNLNAVTNLLTGSGTGASQVLTFQLAGGQSFTATITSSSTLGITVQNALSQLNSALSPHGLAASIDPTTGHLLISGGVAFTATAAAAGSGTGLVAATDTSTNGTLYQVGQTSPSNKPNATFAALSGTDQELLTFTSGTNTVNVTLNVGNANNVSNALATLNNSLAGLGISAVLDTNGTGIAFQSANAFSVTKALNTVANGGQTGVFAATTGAGFTDNSVAPTITAGVTSNALSAITAVNSAIAHLGNVQGAVGAGENKLNYAIGLATSQITSFSAAQSRIRDADMAAEAANLTKAQILQQSSVAAMAQANSAPQAVLALLK